MKMIMRSGIIGLLLGLIIWPVMAQTTIHLKPYTDSSYGLKSVVPESWQDVGGGLFERNQSPTDVTVILQQSVPASADTIMTNLLPRLGLTTAPDSVGTYQSKLLNWTLYLVSFKTLSTTLMVDIALAEDAASGKTYLVSLQTTADEYDALHQTVFLPILDAMLPYIEPPIAHISCLHCRLRH